MLNLTSKLAFSNLVKNRRIYYPYGLASIVSIAILYIFNSLFANPHLDQVYSASNIKMVLGLGIPIVSLTAMIIILYANSFVMKNRSKELGLYGILGLEKRHMSLMLFIEMIYFGLTSIVLGLVTGLIFDNLLYGLLLKAIHMRVVLVSTIQFPVIFATAILFACLYFFIWLLNSWRVLRYASLQMVKEKNSGEKKTRFLGLQTALGLLFLGAGYALALWVSDPVAALMIFFVAVLLVILGTYILFNAGVTSFLYLLKKNKSYYYTPKNFISLSNLIFRMKRNAAGLATISILSSMVLVTLVGGINLYLGQERYITQATPYDFEFGRMSSEDLPDSSRVLSKAQAFQEKIGLSVTKQVNYTFASLYVDQIERGKIKLEAKPQTAETFKMPKSLLVLLDRKEYEQMIGKSVQLEENQVIVYSKKSHFHQGEEFSIENQAFQVKEVVQQNFSQGQIPDNYSVLLDDLSYVVVENLPQVLAGIRSAGSFRMDYTSYVGMNTDLSEEKQAELYQELQASAFSENDVAEDNEEGIDSFASQAFLRLDMQAIMGSLFFIAILLSIVFMMGAVLVIYYKQISEGFEDRERFVILQKVGLSEQQTKQTIRRQIVTVFFLPLITCFIHLAFAFHMIRLILRIFGVTDLMNLLQITGMIAAFFAVVYITVFLITSRSYRKIVSL